MLTKGGDAIFIGIVLNRVTEAMFVLPDDTSSDIVRTAEVETMNRLRADTNPILRRKSVQEQVGLGRSSLYARIKEGLFPRPVKLGGGQLVGWPAHEIAAINGARIAGKTDGEIRVLVRDLEAKRATQGAQV